MDSSDLLYLISRLQFELEELLHEAKHMNLSIIARDRYGKSISVDEFNVLVQFSAKEHKV